MTPTPDNCRYREERNGTKPRLLDLFCGAGGAAVGYHRAGFDVVGVDIAPQPHYPFRFYQDDAFNWLDGPVYFDAVHASPPCQHYSTIAKQNTVRFGHAYVDLYAATRARLADLGIPWVIENVLGAPYRSGLVLCGSMFDLDVRRHRNFETSHLMLALVCQHDRQASGRFRSLDKRSPLSAVVGVHGHINYRGEAEIRNAAMGIDWMTQPELTQAIPPAYTEWIGAQLLGYLSDDTHKWNDPDMKLGPPAPGTSGSMAADG